MTQERIRICGRYLAQHSAFADLVDYSEFTVVVDPTELESANILDILRKRHGRTSRLDMTERLHQVGNSPLFRIPHCFETDFPEPSFIQHCFLSAPVSDAQQKRPPCRQ